MGTDRERLEEASRHVTEAERLVAQQVAVIEKLQKDGHDVTVARHLLDAFRHHLQLYRKHRDLIVQRIGQA